MARNRTRLSIFVNNAPSLFTDHKPHGEGLVAFSLANGLAERGHRVFVYTSDSEIRDGHSPNLIIRAERHRVLMNSLHPWTYMAHADRWLRDLQRTERIDIAWRMYGGSIPRPPRIGSLPLVVGPLSYAWPKMKGVKLDLGRPRFGAGIGPLVDRALRKGYEQTLRRAALLICDTAPLAQKMKSRYPQAEAMGLPLIVAPPIPPKGPRERASGDAQVRLIFVANLYPNKHPLVFAETVKRVREMGLNAEGVIVGDGPERKAIEEWRAKNGMETALCLAGKIPNTEVFQRVSEADFLVSCSIGEPYGRGIAEAMVMGTPAVCHRSGGPADFITHGKDGLLVDELNPQAYAETIAQTIHDASAWNRMSQSARHLAQTEWTKDAVLSRLEEALLAIRRDR